MPRLLLVLSLLVCCAVPAHAASKGLAKQCKATCGATIQQCVDQGGKRRKCKRQIMRTCKQQGIGVCLPADSFTVATTGTDGPGCGMPAAPCRTIQFAVDNLIALGGAGTIKVAAGTYDELAVCPAGTTTNEAVVCILNRQITLLGGFTPPDWQTASGDPSATVLDAQNQGRGLRIQRTGPNEGLATLVMDGFTIENGLAQGTSSGTADQTWAFGGGLLAEGSAVTLRNLVFRNNRAVGGSTSDDEGGRGAGGGMALNASASAMAEAPASLENVRFETNQALGGTGVEKGGFGLGGGLFTYYVDVTADGLVFQGNAATAGSGNGSGVVGLEHSDGLGGAIAIEAGSVATLSHVQASDNVATGGDAPNGEAGGGYGGAVFAELADVTIRDSVVAGNTAQGGAGRNDAGGAIAEGGGIQAAQANVTVERTIVAANAALGGDGVVQGGAAVGGGIAFINGSSPGNGVDKTFTLRNVVVADNRVDVGAGAFVGGGAGGLWIQAAVGTIDHATIAGNRLLNDQLLGAGMTLIAQAGWQTQVTMRNSIVADHTGAAFHPASYANAAIWAGQGTQADLSRTLFANNAHDSNAGISGGLNLPPGTFNVSSTMTAANAGFVAPGTPSYDYHLLPSSPAIDQATASSVSDDLDGDSRPQGAAPDIGADEQ
jgi:hypothetical protein